MAKPAKHYDQWRIRWTDEIGTRRSKTFTEQKTAELALRKLEIEERRRGLRPPVSSCHTRQEEQAGPLLRALS